MGQRVGKAMGLVWLKSCCPVDLAVNLGSYLLFSDGPGRLRSGGILAAEAAPAQFSSNTYK